MESERAKTVEELQTRMYALSRRDLQLWSVGLLIVIILVFGFAALAAPNLMWADHALSVGTRYLPQLLFGFVVLITLFNIYLIAQRRELETARKELMSELLFRQRIENMSLLDPLTQIFNRRYLEYALPREVALANRHDAPLSFLLFDLDDFGRLNSHFGHMAGDEALIATAKLLGSVFGATEPLLRYGGDEFLALLPECSSEQAQERVQQVLAQVRLWNETAGKGYRIALSYGIAEYRQGCDVKDVLLAAESGVQRCRKQPEMALPRNMRLQCLLVSGDSASNHVLQPILESLPIEVETCTDIVPALQILTARQFDAVVVDTALADVAGLSAKIRSPNSVRNLIIVALGCPADAAKLGANFVLQKPLTSAGVARTLRVIHTLMLAERHRRVRHPISASVFLQFDNEPEIQGTAIDVSEGGMAVRCTRTLEAGRTGRVRFALPQSQKFLEARIRITWTDGEGRAGLRFVEMPRSARILLQRWLQEHSKDIAAESRISESVVKLGKRAAV